MTGRKIGRYTVLRKIGEGNMGKVYLAHDPVLDRRIALKILAASDADADARRRFVEEARAAAAVDHPYICKIYDAGENKGVAFIAMELIEGETCEDRLARGALPLKESRRIVAETGEALVKAHEKGIIHRDLKPSNIMLLSDGHVKVVDFGIAKRMPVLKDETVSALNLTQPGGVIGTLAYMSPEQVCAQPVDGRSDIFSLGIIFYEALTGVHPFRRQSPAATAAAILSEPPPPTSRYVPQCPASIEQVLQRMLEKDPAQRYQSATEMLVDLRSADEQATAPVPDLQPAGPSVAVLPFVNRSADREQEYFSDGITDDIIAAISKIAGVKVIARTSMMRYKNTEKDLEQIGRELRVSHVLEGSVRRAGDRVRITAAIVEVATRRQLWAEVYDRALTDVFAIQSELARQMAHALSTTLSLTQAARLAHTLESIEAYHLYLRGRYYLYKLTPESMRKAVHCFQQALDLDPADGRTYAGMSNCYAIAANLNFMPPREGFLKAKAAATRALDLDEALSEAHMSLGLVQMYNEWDWQGADRSFRRAIQLNANSSEAHAYYSWYLALMRRFDEALAHACQAVDVDPLSAVAALNYGYIMAMTKRTAEALNHCHRVLEENPDFLPAKTVIGWIHWIRKNYVESLQYLEAWAWRRSFLARTLISAGRHEEGERVLEEMITSDKERPSEIALIYLALGRRCEAALWLDHAYQERDSALAWLVAGEWSEDRSDPLVMDYLRRMRLES